MLRRLVQAIRACTLIPGRHIPPVRAHPLATPFIASRHPRATHLFPSALWTLDIDNLPPKPPNTAARCPLPIPARAGLCSAQPFISERRTFAVSSPPPILLDVPRRPRLAKDAFPRSHATFRAIAREASGADRLDPPTTRCSSSAGTVAAPFHSQPVLCWPALTGGSTR